MNVCTLYYGTIQKIKIYKISIFIFGRDYLIMDELFILSKERIY